MFFFRVTAAKIERNIMGKYLPGDWDKKINNAFLSEEISYALFEISDKGAELDNSEDIIMLAAKVPRGQLTFENSNGHLLLVPGDIRHQGLAVFEQNKNYHIAAFFTPWDYGYKNFGGQIFLPFVYTPEFSRIQEFVDKELVDRHPLTNEQFDIALSPETVIHIYGNTFMRDYTAFRHAVHSAARNASDDEKKAADEYLSVMKQLYQ